MREILFRGKTTYGTWIEGFLCNNIFNERCIQPIDDIPCINIDQNTVGQFTGILDKNGTKIFEGDIVRLYCGIRGTYVMHILDIRHSFRPFENRVKEIEVIGNIHDNPELLEVKK